ncbi:MAG: ROK family protein [Kiritimatiellaeota bacterium]|nr:ROK family protein [Kiritimatiellota bacterium]
MEAAKQNESRRVLAVDIGGSKVLCGVVDGTGQVLCSQGEPLDKDTGLDGLMSAVRRCGERVLQQCNPVKKTQVGIDAVGATVPGLADAKRGLWVYAPFSGLSDIPIARMLSEMFGAPAAIENDVNACALAEMRFGACREVRDFLWVTVSNGVGGAVVLDGRLYTGAHGNAGEVGHLCVEEDPAKALRCGCGRDGCLEAMASGTGLARRYAEPGVSAKDIGARARAGEPKAREAMARTGEYLGRAIADCVNILNPSAVILGGGVSQDFDLFSDALVRVYRARVFARANPDVRIRQTALGYNAALLGAAALGLDVMSSRIEPNRAESIKSRGE